jgi:hypothetical protein
MPSLSCLPSQSHSVQPHNPIQSNSLSPTPKFRETRSKRNLSEDKSSGQRAALGEGEDRGSHRKVGAKGGERWLGCEVVRKDGTRGSFTARTGGTDGERTASQVCTKPKRCDDDGRPPAKAW